MTLKDVAKELGLSPGTVSDVLNERSGALYRPETRERILRTVQEMGYAPNPRARQLASRRTGEIGVVFTRNFKNPFFGELVGSIDTALRDHRYSMELAMVPDWPTRWEVEWNRLVATRVEGVLVGPIYGPADIEPINGMRRYGLPLVAFGGQLSDVPELVGLDLEYGGRLATEHLIQAGHTRIEFVGATSTSAFERHGTKELGFANAMKQAGLTITHQLSPPGGDLQQDAWRSIPISAASNFARLPICQRPTGVVCTTDRVAMMLINLLHNEGFSIPRDLSCVGFDNISDARYMHPPLTSLDGGLEQQVHLSVQTTIARIENIDAPIPSPIRPHLVERATVRRLMD